MCRRVDCSKCGRPSFVGCGAHIEQVLGDVPPSDRCQCHAERQPTDGDPAVATGRRTRTRDTSGG